MLTHSGISESFPSVGKLKVNGLQISIRDVEATLVYKSQTSFVLISLWPRSEPNLRFSVSLGTDLQLLLLKYQRKIYV